MRPRHRKKSCNEASGEVSINSFANAEKTSSRLKKSQSSNSPLKLAAMSQDKNTEEDDVDWFDRDEDDIVADVEKLKVKEPEVEEEESFTVQVFPYDFWFLLSGFIPPEDIGTFTRISRVTKHIVSTQAFWRRLYTRYYDPDKVVPSIYRPDAMSRLQGYRTRVIKLLHLIYDPFQTKFSIKSSIWPDLDVLVSRVCTLQWITKVSRNQCLFYFKLKDTRASQQKSKHQDPFSEENDDISMDHRLLDDLSDIYYNSENGCKVLQVCGVNWCLIPPLLGQKLNSISVSVSHGMKHHKLIMEFSGLRTRKTDIRVVIDTVANIKVLNWWNPKYKDGQQQTCSRGGNLDPFS